MYRIIQFSLYALLLTLCSTAFSQNTVSDPEAIPDLPNLTDDNGVTIVTGAFQLSEQRAFLGDPASNSGMDFTTTQYLRGPQQSEYHGALYQVDGQLQGTMRIMVGSKRGDLEFTRRSGNTYYYKSVGLGSRHTLVGTYSNGLANYIFTAQDGTKAVFSDPHNTQQTPKALVARLKSLTKPDGEVLEFSYLYSLPNINEGAIDLLTVRSSLGYELGLHYFSNSGASPTMLNRGYAYCDSSIPNCSSSLSAFWPSAITQQSGNITTYHRADGKKTRIEIVRNAQLSSGANNRCSSPGTLGERKIIGGDGDIIRIITKLICDLRNPSPLKDPVEVVTKVIRNGGTWNYNYGWNDPSNPRSGRKNTVTSPTGTVTIYSFNQFDKPLSVEVRKPGESSGLLTRYEYALHEEQFNLLKSITYPEGNKAVYTYEPNTGRINQVRDIAKPGAGLPDRITSYGYTSCNSSNTRYCNKPTSVTDELGQTTYYTYSASHGGLTRVRSPRPASGKNFEQIDYSYQKFHAWYRTSASNTKVRDSRGVWRLTQTRRCSLSSVGSSCPLNSATEVTDVAYENGNSSTPSNVRVKSVTKRSGNNSIVSRETYTYDSWGRLTIVDGPLSGSSDRTYYERDGLGRVLRKIYPDPDGSGSLRHRYTENTYRANGQVWNTWVGYVNAYTGNRTFTRIGQVAHAYDSTNRKVATRTANANGNTLKVKQYAYDSEGRIQCETIRMDTTVFNSIAISPTAISACHQSSSRRIDRITKTLYDGYGRQVAIQRGVSTPDMMEERRTYTDNGQVATVSDGNQNLTTYIYDGHDRLSRTRYPNKTGSGSSHSDYTLQTYKVINNRATSLIATERRRDGNVINFNYDNRGQLTFRNAPGSTNDFSYSYDGLGRETRVTSNGSTLNYVWDALGRLTSERSSLGLVSYRYDAANRRTRLTHPDGFYVTYEYNKANNLTRIRERGNHILATYTYDSIHRLTRLTLGNGVRTYRTYHDGSSYIKDLDITLPTSSSNNLQVDYTYNPAGQIIRKTLSNPSYIPTRLAQTTNYSVNGLNQITRIGSQNVSHDARGNLTHIQGNSYSYDIDNRLTVANGNRYYYDPANRLRQINAGSTTQLAYDSTDLIAEYSTSGSVLRRYVHGRGIDDPIVWYEGSSTSSSARRYLVADERGSISLVTNNSGGVVHKNTYDEYGLPDESNQGRFQYTGQLWLNEVDLYSYKARLYNPKIGRFLQTDPVGYDDQMNLYAYVGNDPYNSTDPSGLTALRDGCGDPIGIGSCGDATDSILDNMHISADSGSEGASGIRSADKPFAVSNLKDAIETERDFSRDILENFEEQPGMTTYFDGFNGTGSSSERIGMKAVEDKLTKALVVFSGNEISNNIEGTFLTAKDIIQGALSPTMKVKNGLEFLRDASLGFVLPKASGMVKSQKTHATVSCSKGGACSYRINGAEVYRN